ncbi:hypothetical protein HOE67_00265 [Candidatus Peregrinibacteria bacterium]|jgi:hypothetical protein|nr:hypothetical protein [Candidatus Peregrinibacteria bacterium]MBT4055526.1 hypothetical protein [Candidatus Peregrinibacteria bacterium]
MKDVLTGEGGTIVKNNSRGLFERIGDESRGLDWYDTGEVNVRGVVNTGIENKIGKAQPGDELSFRDGTEDLIFDKALGLTWGKVWEVLGKAGIINEVDGSPTKGVKAWGTVDERAFHSVREAIEGWKESLDLKEQASLAERLEMDLLKKMGRCVDDHKLRHLVSGATGTGEDFSIASLAGKISEEIVTYREGSDADGGDRENLYHECVGKTRILIRGFLDEHGVSRIDKEDVFVWGLLTGVA